MNQLRVGSIVTDVFTGYLWIIESFVGVDSNDKEQVVLRTTDDLGIIKRKVIGLIQHKDWVCSDFWIGQKVKRESFSGDFYIRSIFRKVVHLSFCDPGGSPNLVVTSTLQSLTSAEPEEKIKPVVGRTSSQEMNVPSIVDHWTGFQRGEVNQLHGYERGVEHQYVCPVTGIAEGSQEFADWYAYNLPPEGSGERQATDLHAVRESFKILDKEYEAAQRKYRNWPQGWALQPEVGMRLQEFPKKGQMETARRIRLVWRRNSDTCA